MGKVLGKLAKFSFNSLDVPLKSTDFDEGFDVIDVTDNATSGDGKETVISRATRTITIEGIHKNSGGDKITGKNMLFTHNSVPYKVTDMSYEVNFDEIDLTDSGTSGDGTEIDIGRAERKVSLDCFILNSAAEIVRGIAQAATLLFATGVTVAGSFRPEGIKIKTELKAGDKVTISGAFQGAVTESNMGLVGGTSAPFVLNYDDGTVSDKAISGTAILMSKKFSANVKGEVTLSYTFKVSGGITETLKS